MQKIDVIIPLYKPDKGLFTLLESLVNQTVPVQKIILMNTEEKYFQRLVQGTDFMEKYHELVCVHHLSKEDFDHGGTRREAVMLSDADIFVMMTQDAVPADTHLIENLTMALQVEQTAAAYARQLPARDCQITERFTRSFNYPGESRRKTKEDIPLLGVKTFFCSNVCAAYKRNIYNELRGFVEHTIFNEDMIYAAGAIDKGYGITYCAEAKVIHSHNYTNKQQLQRNFDLGVSQAEHPEVFAGIRSESEGKKMVGAVTAYLKKNQKKKLLPHFYMQCFCRYLGYWLGKHYRVLPRKLIFLCTSDIAYWHKIQ